MGSPAAISTTSAACSRQWHRCPSTSAFPRSPYVPSNSGYTSPIRTADSRAIAEPPVQRRELCVRAQEYGFVAGECGGGAERVGIHPVLDVGVTQAYRDVEVPLTRSCRGQAAQQLVGHIPEP